MTKHEKQLETWYQQALSDNGLFAKRYVVLFDYLISKGIIKLSWTPPPH